MKALFLPFKLKANTTYNENTPANKELFLPFKLKANTTNEIRLSPCQ